MGVTTTVKDTGPRPGGSLKPGGVNGAKTQLRTNDGGKSSRERKRRYAKQQGKQKKNDMEQHQEQQNERCAECNCLLGKPVPGGEDECMCACHCNCCPLSLECRPECTCDNESHWEAISSDSEDEDINDSTEDKEVPVTSAQSLDEEPINATNDIPSTTMTWTLPDDLSALDMPALVTLAEEGWNLHDPDQTRTTLLDLMALMFTRVYMSSPMETTVKKAAADYPKTTQTEQGQLLQLFAATVIQDNRPPTFFQHQLLDIVKAIHHSRWNFQKILAHRIAAAQLPPAVPINHWTNKTVPTTPAQTAPTTNPTTPTDTTFLFDNTKYTSEQITRMKAICKAPHLIAETTRKPTDDEFTIMYGIMTGSILIRALPQFLKRCCQFDQFQWFHRQMILRAEGELPLFQ
jgi:hypothetical protein